MVPGIDTFREKFKDYTDNSAKVGKAEEKAAEVIDFSKVQVEPLFEGMVDFETFKC